ncbi:MAG: VOC family protein [Conexivisphaerales archaeon]
MERIVSGSKTEKAPGVAEVELIVKDLEAEVSFYQELGLKLRKKGLYEDLTFAEMGTENSAVLKLVQDKNAMPAPTRMAGLYHFAILLPDRKSLGEAYLRIGNKGIPFDGYADHGVSEALYLSDPEGNGIEIYADKPREKWAFDSKNQIQMTTKPLDIDSILTETKGNRKPNDVFPEGTRIGHIHLKVTDLQRSLEFYTSRLGLELTQKIYSAAFLSYSHYHHHVGMNTWESLGGPARRTGFTGLEQFTLVADSDAMKKIGFDDKIKTFSDPDGIKIILTAP